MNKETRSFIWGLIILIPSLFSIAALSKQYNDDIAFSTLDCIRLVLSILGGLDAAERIYKSIN